MPKRTPTTKDVALLLQLYEQEQLLLAPEYQRNNIWPTPAKAYLIDTILNDRPIPLLFLQKARSAQSGRSAYAVIDGQQRLRAVFEYINDGFRLTQSDKGEPYFRKRFSELPDRFKEAIYNYDFSIEDLSGYRDADIRDMFVRINKYVVKLSRQELRHARTRGKFHNFVENVGKWSFWSKHKVFSKTQIKRMRPVEFTAELAILLIEGPQDKKKAVDLYYGQYKAKFPAARRVKEALKAYLRWVRAALPGLSQSRFRKPTDLYALIGAIHSVAQRKGGVGKVPPGPAGKRLLKFERELQQGTGQPSADVAKYLLAASQQTDNITPRKTRIDILTRLILGR